MILSWIFMFVFPVYMQKLLFIFFQSCMAFLDNLSIEKLEKYLFQMSKIFRFQRISDFKKVIKSWTSPNSNSKIKGRYHLSDFYRYLYYRPLFLGLFYCIWLHLFFWTWELFFVNKISNWNFRKCMRRELTMFVYILDLSKKDPAPNVQKMALW